MKAFPPAPLRPFHPEKRLAFLQAAMTAGGLDAALFNYSRTLLYYCGTTHPSVLLVTPSDHRLLVFKAMDQAAAESWMEDTRLFAASGYDHVGAELRRMGSNAGRLGIELDILPARFYVKLSDLLPRFHMTDISRMVLEQRKIKDREEVRRIGEACRIAHSGHERIMETLAPGMTELELSAEIEHAHRKAGHEGLYFIRQPDFFMGRGPLASGERLRRIAGKIQSITGTGLSPSIPMGASSKKLTRGETIVVDIPTHYHGYHCDQSRTYVYGSPSPECRRLYAGLKEIADRTLEALVPGAEAGRLYRQAVETAEELGLGPYFMRIGTAPNIERVGFIGHGLGLELNEPPLLAENGSERMESGMIVALEMEMGGTAGEVVKLEDTVLVTDRGGVVLNATPRGLQVVG